MTEPCPCSWRPPGVTRWHCPHCVPTRVPRAAVTRGTHRLTGMGAELQHGSEWGPYRDSVGTVALRMYRGAQSDSCVPAVSPPCPVVVTSTAGVAPERVTEDGVTQDGIDNEVTQWHGDTRGGQGGLWGHRGAHGVFGVMGGGHRGHRSLGTQGGHGGLRAHGRGHGGIWGSLGTRSLRTWGSWGHRGGHRSLWGWGEWGHEVSGDMGGDTASLCDPLFPSGHFPRGQRRPCPQQRYIWCPLCHSPPGSVPTSPPPTPMSPIPHCPPRPPPVALCSLVAELQAMGAAILGDPP